MQTTTPQIQSEWVKILGKGMITIPKTFRDKLGIKEGEVAKMKLLGDKLVIESKTAVDYEVYSDKELKKMLKDDKLPKKLAEKADNIWSDIE